MIHHFENARGKLQKKPLKEAWGVIPLIFYRVFLFGSNKPNVRLLFQILFTRNCL